MIINQEKKIYIYIYINYNQFSQKTNTYHAFKNL